MPRLKEAGPIPAPVFLQQLLRILKGLRLDVEGIHMSPGPDRLAQEQRVMPVAHRCVHDPVPGTNRPEEHLPGQISGRFQFIGGLICLFHLFPS